MRAGDVARLALGAVRGHGLRTGLMLLALALGVASVVLLIGLGESARRYVVDQFAALGTNLLVVIPGRTETAGVNPSVLMGETPRPLTLEDAEALARSPHVRRHAPVVVGAATVAWGGREREVAVLGTTAAMLAIRRWHMAQGRFLPAGDPRRAQPVVVLGSKLRRELFRDQPALGRWLRIGDRRFRVIGVLGATGRAMGVDWSDMAVVPVASAQALFDTESLFRIIVEARSRTALPAAAAFVEETLARRHQGARDVTVITQDAVLSTFDRVLRALTLAVAGIAGISLGVAGILVMNVMLVSVTQRTAEIGLLKAVGAAPGHILTLFLAEAALLCLLGAGLGLLVGRAGTWVLGRFYPALAAGAPWWAHAAAVATALVTGLLFGALPARRAARLDPVAALARR